MPKSLSGMLRTIWQYFGSQMGRLADVCRELPFQLAPAKDMTLGERVSTIGYPLVRYSDQTQNSQREQLRARADCRTILVGSRFQPRFSPDRAVVHCSMNTATS